MRRWKLGALVGASTAATGFAQLELVNIGDLPGGEDSSWAHSVNADGSVVVGTSTSELGDMPVYWTRAAGLQPLGSIPGNAHGVTDDGSLITGRIEESFEAVAVNWTLPGGEMQRIAIDTTRYDEGSAAFDVSGDGRVVGVAYSSSGGVGSSGTGAIFWSLAGATPSVYSRPDSDYSIGGISADGSTTVGTRIELYGYTARAFYYRSGLHFIGPSTALDESGADAVSADGSVIFGDVRPFGEPAYLFRWTSEGLEDIGMPAGASRGSFGGVAHDGAVAVGQATYPDDWAFLWFEGAGFVDLKEYLLDRGLAAAADWQFVRVIDISHDGTAIVGLGYDPRGRRRGFLVSGLDLGACYADCDDSGSLDFFDFLCYQNLFAAGDPAADCDGSGELDFFDFLCFQNAFAAGCV